MDLSIRCKRCDAVFTLKGNLAKHLRRKNICEALDTDNDIPREDLLAELSTVQYNDKTYDCEFCGRRFNNTSNRSAHRKICKDNPHNLKNIDILRDIERRVEVLEDRIKMMQTQVIIRPCTNRQLISRFS